MDDIYFYMMVAGTSMQTALTPEERDDRYQFLWAKANLADEINA